MQGAEGVFERSGGSPVVAEGIGGAGGSGVCWGIGCGGDCALGGGGGGNTCPPRPLVCAPLSIAPAVVHDYAGIYA